MLRLLALAMLFAASAFSAEKAKLLVIGQGSDGHPPGTHEFMAGTRVVQALLSGRSDIEVTVVKAD